MLLIANIAHKSDWIQKFYCSKNGLGMHFHYISIVAYFKIHLRDKQSTLLIPGPYTTFM